MVKKKKPSSYKQLGGRVQNEQKYYEYLNAIIAEASRKSLLCIKCLKTRLAELPKGGGSSAEVNYNLLATETCWAEGSRKSCGSAAEAMPQLKPAWRKGGGSLAEVFFFN